MRIRRRAWTTEELENSKFYIKNPVEYKGKWKEQFENNSNPLHIELGCGKGSFISELAFRNQDSLDASDSSDASAASAASSSACISGSSLSG